MIPLNAISITTICTGLSFSLRKITENIIMKNGQSSLIITAFDKIIYPTAK